MRRPIIIDGLPFISDYYRKPAKTLHAETGGNTGNLAFRYAIASHLGDPVRFMSWADIKPEQVRAQGDIIVLPCANQLGAHTDLAEQAAALRNVGLPIVALGLGAQAESQDEDIELTAGTEDWLQTIAQLAPSEMPNIGARGAYTQAQINKLGHPGIAAVTGCPSNFINYFDDIAGSIEEKFYQRPRSIAVAAGIPTIAALRDIEVNLADLVTISSGAYIVQHDLRMLQIARGEFDALSVASLEASRDYIQPDFSLSEFKLWCRRWAYAFYDARAWMDFVRRFDFVVGTRYHGIMLALQAGVPAACISHDSRTTELCETTGVPVRHYSEIKQRITRDNIRDIFHFSADQYRITRRSLFRDYLQVLRDADLRPADTLLELERRILEKELVDG